MDAVKNNSPLLSVVDLNVQIKRSHDCFYALKNISIDLAANETLALVGQSASGKTMTALALIGLLPEQTDQVSGTFFYQGTKFSFDSPESYQHLRGKEIALIFQEPKSALNPVMSIGRQLKDVIQSNRNVTANVAKKNALKLLNDVGFLHPETIYKSYVHQLSGGMAQRILIAMALSCNPSLIIADEITTSLDVSTQIQILNLIKEIQNKIGFSLLLISHDINVVRKIADSVCVMSNGEIIEKGKTLNIFKNPQKPETKALLSGLLNNSTLKKQAFSDSNDTII